MRIYPDADVYFFVDKPGCWGSYMKHGSYYSWKLPPNSIRPKNMHYWLDLDGLKKKVVNTEDLYFKDWPESRIRDQACLGMLYSTGFRFIRILMAPPANFKCAPLPVNLEMAHKVNRKCNKYTKIVSLCK